MGKTKTKIMDDSVSQDQETKKPSRKLGRQDDLVERLKAELAGEEAKKKPAKSESYKKDSVIASGAKQSSQEKEDRHVAVAPRDDKEKKAQKPGKSKPRSKKYKQSLLFFDKKSQEVDEPDKGKLYPLNEAVELTKKLSYSKFVGTMEAHINTINTGIRGLVSLPFVSGKKLQILAFGPNGSIKAGENITLGDDSTIEEINKGKVNFDLIITMPDWMPKLSKVARILGPRGLMPNPKNGTITNDLKKTIEGFQMGKTEYKTEPKAKVIHLGLGKLNQPTEELSANISVLLQTLGKSRVLKVSLSPTMGPSVKVDLSSL